MTNFGFLTIMNFLNSQLSTLPRIGAGKSWLLEFMLVSLIFCFYTVVEYIFVNYLYRVERRVDKIQEIASKQKKKRIMNEMERNNACRIAAANARHGTKNTYSTINGLKTINDNFHMKDIENVRATKADMAHYGLCRIDHLLLKQDGTMFFKDQHVDIFSRYGYPIVFSIIMVVISR